MPRLLANVQQDEEVIVIDGASTDGTVEFVEDFVRQGRIHRFLTEADKGEAHGFNKGLLLARGELIKFVTDDDLFSFRQIQQCRIWMLKNSEYDVMGTNGLVTLGCCTHDVGTVDYHPSMAEWCERKTPFPFCGLGLMLRRSSLALLGLLHTSFVRVDAEYSLRVTAGPGQLAFYTGATFLRIMNEKSNACACLERMKYDTEFLERAYGARFGRGPSLLRNVWRSEFIQSILPRRAKELVMKRMRHEAMPTREEAMFSPDSIGSLIADLEQALQRTSETCCGMVLVRRGNRLAELPIS